MKFKDAIAQGLDKRRTEQAKANAREKQSARLKNGKTRQRRPLVAEGGKCDKPTIGKPAHCGTPGCYDHEGWS